MSLNIKGNKEREYITIRDCTIDRAVNNQYGVFFDFTINGVSIKGANLAQNKDGEIFIGLPSRKGKDNKYYPIVYISFSQEDTQKIIDMIDKKING
jgi:DNA-binding cell septation regulator SpoVG